MERHLNLLSSLYAIALSLFIFNTLVIELPKHRFPISPLAESFSVLAAHDKNFGKSYKVFGFLPYWNLEKTDRLQLDKLTDIAYFALTVNADGSIRKYTDEGFYEPGYNNWHNSEELRQLIKEAKENNVNIALTIISHEDENTDALLDCSSCWERLLIELREEMQVHNVTSINFDFEYFEYTEPEKAAQYTNLIAYIHENLDSLYGDSQVTVSAFADSFVKPRITDVGELANVVDGIFIMAYDFHRPTSDQAGPIAPIEGAGIYSEYDIQTMLKDYLSNVPPNKLILGVPYYGYNWVVDGNQPYSERIPGNEDIGFSVSQSYARVIDTILEVNPAVQWDDLARAPYFSYISPETGSSRIVYFENSDSLEYKYRLAKNLNLGGVGIWALGYDGGYQELWDLLHKEFFL